MRKIYKENLSYINVKHEDLSCYTSSLSVSDIKRYIDEKSLKIPSFQRDSFLKNSKSTWGNETKVFYIDSILRGLPSPSILIWEKVKNDKKEYYLLDGSQRLSSIIEFIDNKLKLNTSELMDFYNKSYNDLAKNEKDNFDNYRIEALFIRYVGKKQDILENSIISEIFRRLNSGSYVLNNAEIRHAIYYDTKLKVFKKIEAFLSEENYFNNFLRNIGKFNKIKDRGKKETFLLRLLSYSYFICNDKNETFDSSIDYVIDKYIYKITLEEITNSLEKIKKIFQFLHDEQEDIFCMYKKDIDDLNKKSLHEPFAESFIAYLFFENMISYDNLSKIDWKNFHEIKRKIWNDGFFANNEKKSSFSNESCFFYTTTSNKNVWNRFEYLKKNIKLKSK